MGEFKENIPGGSGRPIIYVRTMWHTRWTINVDAMGSIHSTWDDDKYVDRARFGDEDRNSRQNENISLPVRDHAGHDTADRLVNLRFNPKKIATKRFWIELSFNGCTN